ncbi:sugar-binding domain-containing protein [Bacteroides sp. 51]|uniref:glycosyl hydrolase 2 galactose-binding domain-containing protein n=1 Tax=Bacteroides sp. 51 TaxID=2302938 RepID=UPI0013D6D1BE|nr:sugar-binding domain-containing protein [Bacteroides sp. 51]
MKKHFSSILVSILVCANLLACTNMIAENRQVLLSDNWQIQQSGKTVANGQALSSTNVSTSDWYKATVPSTVMGVLTANGLYKDLLIDMNYKEADKTPFDSSWWYRTTFKLSKEDKNRHISLDFDGITYRANVWLNGRQIASKEDMYGPFCRFSYDITDVAGEDNVLAVEIFRAQVAEPNIGFVDWNPRPLDESMGIFREVRLNITGDVKMKNTHVQSRVNTETLKEAWVTVETELSNLSDKSVSGKLVGEIGNIKFTIPVKLDAKERKVVKIDPETIKDLHILNPRLWWSADLGQPELYQLNLKFIAKNNITSQEDVTFGIRQIDTYFTEAGHRGFILNGQKVLIKGAGWTDDIFLRDTPETNERQVKYVRDMNMNTIRFENIWGNSQNLYDMCDKYGILALVGWSCQWEWKGYLGVPDDEFGCIRTEEDMNLLTRFLNDQVVWLRNHPSIIAWYGGSDKLLRPELEKKYMALLPTIDNRPYIGSAKGLTSSVTGRTGMKMVGPYEYVGPDYWFLDSIYGGAYGFNTETGPGAQMPVYESIVKMIPEDKLWPLNDVWNYHCTTARVALNTLDFQNNVIDGMYGKPENLQEYLQSAYLLNYESTKSMFEAFRVNRKEATGLIQWMLNSAWPSLYWQLYDYYQIPVPAYYGVKTANMPHQLIYNYKDNGIYAVNETLTPGEGLKAVIKGFSIDSKPVYEEEIAFSTEPNSSKKIFTIENTLKNSFVSLNIYNAAGEQIAENFYCLSSIPNEYDWKKTDWVGTPMTGFADFKDLRKMPNVDLKLNTSLQDSKNGKLIRLEIENPSSTIALFTCLKLKDAQGEIVCPSYWDDNYISILPGEKVVLHCDTDNAKPDTNGLIITASGYNVKEQKVEVR